ncbi:MAG: hypothetical protein KI793_33855 [Rivularia sp. (in: Bacteria)]|nr:hypothetical protein [Rivularia sp. MS3]
MIEYAPTNLLNTKLDFAEEHHYSYTINPLRKQLGCYHRYLEYYTIHITNKRLILESYINHDILINYHNLYPYLPSFDDLLAFAAFTYKNRIIKAKKNMQLIKYKSVSLEYKYIDTIGFAKSSDIKHHRNVGHIQLLADKDHDIESFKILDFCFFKVFPVCEITLESLQDTFKNIFSDDNDALYHFIIYGNLFLNQFRASI